MARLAIIINMLSGRIKMTDAITAVSKGIYDLYEAACERVGTPALKMEEMSGELEYMAEKAWGSETVPEIELQGDKINITFPENGDPSIGESLKTFMAIAANIRSYFRVFADDVKTTDHLYFIIHLAEV